MKGSIPEDKLEEIRRRTDIVSLVGEYVTLKKAGKNFLGLCPFHREKTPSFTVSPDKQMFYCFGCSEGGNAVSFLMKLNHMGFPEAVRHLAGKVGVAIPEKTMSRGGKESYTLSEQIRHVNELAAGFFIGTLQSSAGEEAREYLRKRGIGDAAVKAFRLGYVPGGWNHLFKFLEKKGVSPALAEQAGLLVSRTGKGERGYYDRFRGRLMIPIEDVDGHVIAFGGRVVDAGLPKYMNSPESAVYTKGNNLYGLAKTREVIREKGFAILVEGYFDLIALWSVGILNVVATLGTALTRTQVELIRRYTANVAAVFDPDEAGRKALARSLELFLAGNVHARAVILPDGYDPDDFVRTQGREKMEQMVAHALPMVDYYIDKMVGGRGTLEEDRDKLREAVVFISRLEDAVDRNLFVKRVAEKLNVDQEVLKDEVHRVLSHKPAVPLIGQPIKKAAEEIDPVEMSLIHMMVEYPARIATVEASGVMAFFMTEELKSLGEALMVAARQQEGVLHDMSSLISSLAQDSLKGRLLERLVRESPYQEEWIDRMLTDAIRQIQRKWYKEGNRVLREKIGRAERAGNQELSNSLLMEKEKLKQEEKRITESA